MKPSDLIKSDLGEDVWAECWPRTSTTGDLPTVDELSPFQSLRTYIIHGRTRQFDFPALPHGSYCIYVADGRRAVRLTRAGKEIECVLKEKWDTLADCNPVILASLILKFFDGGICSTHHILSGEDDLRAQYQGYVLNDREFERVQGLIGTTSTNQNDDQTGLVIRAVTLCGWMHDKRNLGIEHIHISKSGVVHLEKRKVLTKKIFKSVPQIRY